jgi:DNA invertase Pin-like site-specific DNA recombinase
VRRGDAFAGERKMTIAPAMTVKQRRSGAGQLLPNVAVKLLRFSGHRSQQGDNSLPAQDRGIDDYILSNPRHPLHGTPVIRTFRVKHGSHDGLTGVDAFDEMIAMARRGEMKYILVDKYDRFGRNTQEALQLEKELNRLGAYIVSAKEQFDVSQPSGWLAKTMMQVLADFYSRNLASETKKGMREKLERGEWPYPAPIGFSSRREARHTCLEADPKTAPLITEGFRRFSTGRYTLREWADEAWRSLGGGRSGTRVTPSGWQAIFRNRMYVGTMETAAFPGIDFELHPSAARLIDAETFARVQAILNERTNGKSRRGVFSYPLAPVLWSAELDCQFHGETQVKRGLSYYRSRTKQQGRRIYLSTTKAEAGLIDVLKQLTISRGKAEELREAIVDRWQQETPEGHAKALEAMRASVREQDQRIKRLVGLYVSGEVSREHFQSLKADYEEVKFSKLEALKALEDDAKDQRVVLDEALVILGDLPALWTSLDDHGKQAWVQVLFQKLVINDRGKVVDRVLNHPFDEILEFKKGRSNSVRLSSP